MAEQKFPIRGPRRLHKIGGGYAVFLPLEWFRAHNIDPEKTSHILMDAGRHIVFVNPKDVEKEYASFSKEVKRKMRESGIIEQGDK